MSKNCGFIAFVVIFLSPTLVKGISPHVMIGEYSTKNCGFSSRTPGMYTNCFEWHNKLTPILKAGRNATLEEAPWLVHVFYNSSTYQRQKKCTGSIISNQWILTAAQCLFPRDKSTEYSIIFGVNQMADQNGIVLSNLRLKGVEAIRFPKYENPSYAWSMDMDIALIKLEKPIDSIDNPVFKRHRSICLPERNIQVQRNEFAFTAGWGKLDVLKESPQIGSRKVLFMGKNRRYSDLPTIYTNKLEGQGTICYSDLGGPLWQYSQGRAVLIGVTSGFEGYVDDLGCEDYGTFRQRDTPFTGRNMSIVKFVRVSKNNGYFIFIDWILNVTQLNLSSVTN